MNILSVICIKNKIGLSIFNSLENSIFILNTQSNNLDILKIFIIKYKIDVCLFPNSFNLHDFYALNELKIKMHFSVARKLKTPLIEKIAQIIDQSFFISLLSLEPLFFYLRKNEDFLDFSIFVKIDEKKFDDKILIGEINCINLILIYEWKNLMLNLNCIKSLFLLGSEIHANCAIKNKQPKSIFSLINYTKTTGGKNKLREWMISPLIYEDEIKQRYKLIDHAIKNISELKNIFKNIKIVHKIEDYFINDKKIFFINLCNNLKNFINLCKIFNLTDLQFSDEEYLNEINKIIFLLNENIDMDESSQFILKISANEDIKNLRINYANIENLLTAEAKKLQSKYKIPLSIIYIPNFKYLIETFHKIDNLKVIIKLNEIFYCTSSELEILNEKIGDIEIKIHLCELHNCNLIFEKIKNLKICIANNFISKIDAIFSMALCKEKFSAVRPKFVKNHENFQIKNFLFLLKIHEKIFLNIKINSPTVITGENGSGKTAILQSIGHIVILSQMGAFIFADEIILPIFTNITCKIFSTENKKLNCSAFFSELIQIKNVVKNYANNNCLFLIDEFGKGCKFEETIKISTEILKNIKSKYFLWITNYQQNLHKFSHIKYLQLIKNEKTAQNFLYDGIFLKSCIKNLFLKLKFSHEFMEEFFCIKNNLNKKESAKKNKWVVEKINSYL